MILVDLYAQWNSPKNAYTNNWLTFWERMISGSRGKDEHIGFGHILDIVISRNDEKGAFLSSVISFKIVVA